MNSITADIDLSDRKPSFLEIMTILLNNFDFPTFNFRIWRDLDFVVQGFKKLQKSDFVTPYFKNRRNSDFIVQNFRKWWNSYFVMQNFKKWGDSNFATTKFKKLRNFDFILQISDDKAILKGYEILIANCWLINHFKFLKNFVWFRTDCSMRIFTN